MPGPALHHMIADRLRMQLLAQHGLVKLAPLSRPRNGETKVVDIIHLDWEIENSRRAVGMWES